MGCSSHTCREEGKVQSYLQCKKGRIQSHIRVEGGSSPTCGPEGGDTVLPVGESVGYSPTCRPEGGIQSFQ